MTAKTDAQAALAAAMTYKETLADEDASLVFNDVEREVARLRADIDTAIDDLRTAYGVDAAEAIAKLALVADALQQLAEARAAALKHLVPYVPETDTSAGLIAFELYQDIERALEVVDLNPGVISNPNAIPAGTSLQVYDQ